VTDASADAARGALPIDGLLTDIDGVLVVSWEAISGATAAVRQLQDRGVPFRLITNTTTITRDGIAERLVSAGFDVTPNDILTAPLAAASYIRRHHPGARCYLLGVDDVAADLEGIELVDRGADVVIVAGADPAFTFENINRAFRMILDGAALVAMHRNLYWMEAEGMSLDAGAYLLGLEAATGATAAIAGKPSPDFFQSGLELLGLPAERVAMVGDDIGADVLAAQAMGMQGVLVRTGKFRPEQLDSAGGSPDVVVDSVADVPALVTESGETS
jgi:HAD superfamily hydrolase (TIGR01458 family)